MYNIAMGKSSWDILYLYCAISTPYRFSAGSVGTNWYFLQFFLPPSPLFAFCLPMILCFLLLLYTVLAAHSALRRNKNYGNRTPAICSCYRLYGYTWLMVVVNNSGCTSSSGCAGTQALVRLRCRAVRIIIINIVQYMCIYIYRVSVDFAIENN